MFDKKNSVSSFVSHVQTRSEMSSSEMLIAKYELDEVSDCLSLWGLYKSAKFGVLTLLHMASSVRW